MLVHVIVLLAGSSSAMGNGEQTSPGEIQLSATQKAAVDYLADVYRTDRGKAEQNYQMLLGSDRTAALKAVDELAQKKHFELAALAISDVKEPDVKNNLIRYVLVEKRRFSPKAFSVAIRELEHANSTDAGDDGEAVAGVENIKAALASAIARWLDIPDPKLPKEPDESKPGYTSFIAQARQKAATMTEDVPN